MLTGVLLAGGRSRRMGRDKAQLVIEGQTMLDRTLAVLQQVTDEVLVSGFRERAEQVPPGVRVIEDQYTDAGPLAGIYSALLMARNPHVLAVACDMPFLNADLLRHMSSLAEDYDVVIPNVDGHTEQLHAIYSKSSLPLIKEQLDRGDYKIDRWFGRARVYYVTEEEVGRFDPQHRSFMNVNTPEEWQAAQELIEAKK